MCNSKSKEVNNWKKLLLKSGKPLENEVAHKLDKMGFEVGGPYSYERTNENGVIIECSVDIHAFDLLRDRRHGYWGNLDLLVECKYNHPGINWVFLPYPSDESLVMNLLKIQQRLTTRKLANHDFVEELESKLCYSLSGVALHSSGNDQSAIEHGLSQLRYAIPYIMCSTLDDQADTCNESDLSIGFLCPMLVTNAPLYILKHEVTTDAVRLANNLNDVAESVEMLVVNRNPGPDLNQHTRHIYSASVNRNANVHSRWEKLQELESDIQGFKDPTAIEAEVQEATHQVLVIRLQALEYWITLLRSKLQTAGRTLRRVAKLEKDPNGPWARIVHK